MNEQKISAVEQISVKKQKTLKRVNKYITKNAIAAMKCKWKDKKMSTEDKEKVTNLKIKQLSI